MNRIATATSSRDISAQVTALLCTLAPRMQLTASHTQLLTPYSGRAKSRTMAKARTIGLVQC